MGIFDLFRNRKNQQIEDSSKNFKGPIFFYHEDDFLQVEIVPNDNLVKNLTENNKIVKFAKDHSDGVGFTDIYVRNNENTLQLNQRKINPKDLEKIFEKLDFERISQVLTGYGENYRELHNNCIAFCKDYSAILYDFKDDIVQHIWLTNHWSFDKNKFSNFLNDLGIEWQVLLQDWNLTETIDLQDKQAIIRYLDSSDEA